MLFKKKQYDKMKGMYLMKKTISFIASAILLLTSAFAFSSCSQNELYSEGNGNLQVVCTIFAPFDVARSIGGENVTVTLLQDNGSDMHNYSPTSATLDALRLADVFIYIGGESDEAWVKDTVSASGNHSLVSVSLTDTVEPVYAELENDWADHSHSEDGHGHGEDGHDHSGDEHVWTSLKNMKKIALAIQKAFSEKDSANSETYESRANAYISELDKLDAEYGSAVANAGKELVVFADRFPFVYLMHDYSIAYKAAFSGCSTEVNASFETQISLINAVKNTSLKYVLTIEGSDKTLARSIAKETGCEVLSLNSLQSVTRSDIESGVTYLKIMNDNLSVLKEALK